MSGVEVRVEWCPATVNGRVVSRTVAGHFLYHDRGIAEVDVMGVTYRFALNTGWGRTPLQEWRIHPEDLPMVRVGWRGKPKTTTEKWGTRDVPKVAVYRDQLAALEP